MTNKGILTDNKIVIEGNNDVKIKSKGKNLCGIHETKRCYNYRENSCRIISNHYVNLVENSTRVAPIELVTPLDPNL